MITTIEGSNYLYFQNEINGRNAAVVTDNNRYVGGQGDTAIHVKNTQKTTLIEDNFVDGYKYGINVRSSADVDIFDYQFFDTRSDNKYAAAIVRQKDHDEQIYAQRIYADGEDKPLNKVSGGYKTTNTDFFTNNVQASSGGSKAPQYFRDISVQNFSDSMFDAKSTVYIMNATLENAFRIFRVWDDAEIIVVNSIIRTGAGAEHAWLRGSGTIKYYNTLWDGERRPDMSDVDIYGVAPNQEAPIAQRQIVELSSNPLPGIDDFFALPNVRYSAEVRVNGDRWIDLEVPNGGDLRSFIGDPLFRIPDLGNGRYEVRTFETKPGGSTTKIDDVSFDVKNLSFAYKGGVSKAKLGYDGAVGSASIDDGASSVAATSSGDGASSDVGTSSGDGASSSGTETTEAIARSDVIVFLVDTRTDQKITNIWNGKDISASAVANRDVGVAVEFRDGAMENEIDYVVLSLNGGMTRTEAVAPYALFGDRDGDYFDGQSFGKADYRLKLEFHAERGDDVDVLLYDFDIV